MMRHPLRSFTRGLWVNGGRDAIPQDALRRATGVHQLRQGVLRSASPVSQKNVVGGNQYVRFQGALYQGEGNDLYRDAGSIDDNQDGTRLSFLRMPPQVGIVDYLFVAGGGAPLKVDAAGAVTAWGIVAPADGTTATKGTARTKAIDSFSVVGAPGWHVTTPTVGVVLSEGTIAVDGTSVKFTTDGSSAVTSMENTTVPIDLTAFDTPDVSASVDQDYISFWFRCADPDRITSGVEVSFSLNNVTFEDDVFTRMVKVTGEKVVDVFGVGQKPNPSVFGGVPWDPWWLETDVVNAEGNFAPGRDTNELLDKTARSTIPRLTHTWLLVRVAKASFTRSGTGDYGWDDVKAVRISVHTDASGKAIDCYFDKMDLHGGYGMVGKYQYYITYKNSTTGSRSNPNPTPIVTVDGNSDETTVDREPINLASIPQSSDDQADVIEIWRTVGNGEAFFYDGEIADGVTEYTSETADYDGMYPGATVLDLSVQHPELPIDNAPPPDTIGFILPTSHVGRAWFLDDAAANVGRAFYSAVGRPESSGAEGWVPVTETDEPLQALARWNDVVYAFSSRRVFRIIGEDEPFTSQEVFGAPGTLDPDSVVVAAQGIIYAAIDGVRLFTGASAELIAYDAIAPAFRGLSVEGMTAIASTPGGLSGAVLNDDYYLADGFQVLVLNLRDGTWRRHSALSTVTVYAESDNSEILASSTLAALDQTLILDDENGDISINFEVQTASVRFSTDVLAVIRRVFFDIDTQGQDIVPVLVLDSTEVTLPVLNTASRQLIEIATNSRSRIAAIRLTGTTLAIVRIYGIEFDVYVPGQGA